MKVFLVVVGCADSWAVCGKPRGLRLLDSTELQDLMNSSTRWHAVVGWELQLQSRWCQKLTSLPLIVGWSITIIMITPAFDLSQDPEYLTITLRVPYTRTAEFDLYVDGTDFKFYAKPYFLR